MFPSSNISGVNSREQAEDLQKIQRIMNREFAIPHFGRGQRPADFSRDPPAASSPSSLPLRRVARNLEHRPSRSNTCAKHSRPAATQQTHSLDHDLSRSPMLVNDFENGRRARRHAALKRHVSPEDFSLLPFENRTNFSSKPMTFAAEEGNAKQPPCTLKRRCGNEIEASKALSHGKLVLRDTRAQNSRGLSKNDKLNSPESSSSPTSLSDISLSDFEDDQEAKTLRENDSDRICQCSPQDDTFDPENMPAPLTSALLPLQHEYHRLSRSFGHPDYVLGQEGHTIDMVCEATRESAKLAISFLRQFDCAFIKRSDGRWSYSMLIQKIQPGNDFNKWTLRFVVDEFGSTKTVTNYCNWGEHVRLIKEPIEVTADRFNKMRKKGPLRKLVTAPTRPIHRSATIETPKELDNADCVAPVPYIFVTISV